MQLNIWFRVKIRVAWVCVCAQLGDGEVIAWKNTTPVEGVRLIV